MAPRRARMAPAARRRFLEAIAYVAERNPAAAERIVQEMRALQARLITFPNLGVRGDIPGTRRIVMAPYVITTRTQGDTIEIVAFRHGRQEDARAPSELLEDLADDAPPKPEGIR
ncbi:type II toxin-antitoxin system RelE/ParE family toxin [Aquibium microcysteis]|uniref:type II toxin-antitoxin system RelE/ParE family toxin n=1 Tax=Aquibium microcysteis TaxID=675281 RepID=UPI00165D26C1|nr:type II toxin-antitoxin system RelE/ParE family toxin [Aquibium microcysteis]